MADTKDDKSGKGKEKGGKKKEDRYGWGNGDIEILKRGKPIPPKIAKDKGKGKGDKKGK